MANVSAAKLRRQARRARSISSEGPQNRTGLHTDLLGQEEEGHKDRQNHTLVKQATSLTVTRQQGHDVIVSPIVDATVISPSQWSPHWHSRVTRKLHVAMSKPLPPVRLLIASLGNPRPYHSTRHSAGHVLLNFFASNLSFPPFRKDKTYAGSVSFGAEISRPEYTLWQSPSQMNVSGSGVLKAWKHFVSQQQNEREDVVTALVILHDDLETAPFQLKVRRGEGSAKGHNGIKSVQASLKGAGLLTDLEDRFVKIGMGIGRPVSRDREDVSAWVLGPLTGPEKAKIEGAAPQLRGLLDKEVERLGRS